MKAEAIIKKLEELPTEIMELEEEKFDLVSQKTELEQLISICIADIKTDINESVNDDGKKTFSNESARKAEFERRSIIDENLSAKQERLKGLEQKIFKTTLQRDFLHSVQTNYRSILNYHSK